MRGAEDPPAGRVMTCGCCMENSSSSADSNLRADPSSCDKSQFESGNECTETFGNHVVAQFEICTKVDAMKESHLGANKSYRSRCRQKKTVGFVTNGNLVSSGGTV
jgi:hypothetical protein